MPQQNLPEFIADLEKIGQLQRITEEKRADELPSIMDSFHDKAVLVEKVKDHDFPFLAGAFSTRAQYAYALGCNPREISARVSKLAARRIKPVTVDTAPCKDIIRK